MRALLLSISIFALSACTLQTFDSVTDNVNNDFALGAQLRDRCAITQDLSDCLAWRNYKNAEEAKNPLMNYDAALSRWEREGPY